MEPSKTLVHSLTLWFKTHKRDLPWRKTSDPYRIWLSEVMLQQTQVATVLPYFKKFTKTFPTLLDLARSNEDQVLALWSGLGYYSRARNLHKGARFLVSEFNGQFPKTRMELLRVPGIGPYTAGAILSIAHHLNEPLVDGNVERVFSRLFGWNKPTDTPQAKRFFWEQASKLVSFSKEPQNFNQALMELGSLICTKASPKCDRCPVQSFCVAFKKEKTAEWPFKMKKMTFKPVHLLKYFIEHDNEFFLKKNTTDKWWKGLWDVPTDHVLNPKSWKSKASTMAAKIGAQSWKECHHYTHTVTNHRITVIPIRLQIHKRSKRMRTWFTKKQIEALGTSALLRKIVLQEL